MIAGDGDGLGALATVNAAAGRDTSGCARARSSQSKSAARARSPPGENMQGWLALCRFGPSFKVRPRLGEGGKGTALELSKGGCVNLHKGHK